LRPGRSTHEGPVLLHGHLYHARDDEPTLAVRGDCMRSTRLVARADDCAHSTVSARGGVKASVISETGDSKLTTSHSHNGDRFVAHAYQECVCSAIGGTRYIGCCPTVSCHRLLLRFECSGLTDWSSDGEAVDEDP
jgi:hypothetical protein